MNRKFMIMGALVILVIGLVVTGLVKHHDICLACIKLPTFSAESIRHYIQGFGNLAIVVYVLLYTVNTFSPFFPPIFFMSLAAGAIFGPYLGTLALTLGTMSGTTAAFFVARYVGGSWLEKKIQSNSKSTEIYENLSQNGFFILLPIRLIGFPPYGIIDFICGLSKMKFRDFFLATLIGASPWIIIQVLLADRFAGFDIKDPNSYKDPVLWGLIIVFVSMIIITGKIVKKREGAKNGKV